MTLALLTFLAYKAKIIFSSSMPVRDIKLSTSCIPSLNSKSVSWPSPLITAMSSNSSASFSQVALSVSITFIEASLLLCLIFL